MNAAQSWNQAFGYDRYGNRWFDPATSGAVMGPISSQSDVSASNNRLVKAGYSYDAAGNMTAEPGKSYTFDGENKIATATVSGAVSTYVYDGDGRRVKKATPQGASVYVYDAAGQMIAEYSDTPATGPGGTQYATADHLGTPRLWTNQQGTIISRHDYLPFGEELFSGLGGRTTAQGYSPSAQTDGQRKQFTSKERDTETNLDYFLARYYGSAQGRFISPDEFTGGIDELYNFAENLQGISNLYADQFEPQSFNKYQYTYNNPLRYVDPDGHAAEKPGLVASNRVPGPPIPFSPPVELIKPLADALGEATDKLGEAIRTSRPGQLIRQVTGVEGDPTINIKPLPGPPGPPAATIPGMQAQPLAPPAPAQAKEKTKNARKANPDRVEAAKKELDRFKTDLEKRRFGKLCA